MRIAELLIEITGHDSNVVEIRFPVTINWYRVINVCGDANKPNIIPSGV